MIASSCQKLISIFHQRPEQKIVFITQHGLLPLMELLEVPKPRVSQIAMHFILLLLLASSIAAYNTRENCFQYFRLYALSFSL